MWARWWASVVWACLVLDCWAWSLDGMHHNFATTRRHTPDWTFSSPKNIRRTHLQRIWEDSSAGQPFLPYPAARPYPPQPLQLQNNELLFGDEDYEDVPSSIWMGQSTASHPHPRQTSTSLQGLQHLLEGEVRPTVEQGSPHGVPTGEQEDMRIVPFSRQQLSQHQVFAKNLGMFPQGNSDEDEHATDHEGSQTQPPTFGRYNSPHASLGWPGTLSKELLKDILDKLAVDQLSRHSQIPGDFLGKSRLMGSQDLDQLPPDVADDQYSKSSPKEVILRNLLGEAQLINDNRQTDIMSRVGAPDYPDHEALPNVIASHQDFGQLMDQDIYTANTQNDDLSGLSTQNDKARGSEWLPSTLSRFTIPSSKDMTKTCHARHLHTCGGKVIEEFSHEPDYADTCRIREEFLDCMENEQREPCRLQGEHFTHERTRRIIERIKKLLWSARGCILSHSP